MITTIKYSYFGIQLARNIMNAKLITVDCEGGFFYLFEYRLEKTLKRSTARAL